MKTLLQKWWEETYPHSGVKEVKNLSDGNFTLDMALSFSTWCENINKINSDD